MGAAQHHQLRAVFQGFFHPLQVQRITPRCLVPQQADRHHPALVQLNGGIERPVYRRDDSNAVAFLRKAPHAGFQPRDHAGQHLGFARLNGQPMPPLPETDQRFFILFIFDIIAIAGMLGPLLQGIHNGGRAGEIHVRHPQGNAISIHDSPVVPLFAVRVPAIHDLVEIRRVKLHAACLPRSGSPRTRRFFRWCPLR